MPKVHHQFPKFRTTIGLVKSSHDVDRAYTCMQTMWINPTLGTTCHCHAQMKSRDFEGAEKLFDEMLQRGVKPNNFTFSTMVNCANKPMELFEKMFGFGYEPDGITCSAMVYAYGLSNNVDKVVSLYDCAIVEKWCLGVAALLALIKMYSMAGNYDRCLKIYQEMKVLGVKPNVVTYNSLLGAMLKAKKHQQAKAIYKEMRKKTQEQIYESVAWDNEAYPNTIVPRRTGSTTHSEGADGHGSPLPSMTQRVKETSHGYSRNATKESQSRPRGETMQNR
ncbi:hypothetical protein JHK86_009908 [Glycine max]|nr:hypothetical protein JHK86_009908 [Glycine max]